MTEQQLTPLLSSAILMLAELNVVIPGCVLHVLVLTPEWLVLHAGGQHAQGEANTTQSA